MAPCGFDRWKDLSEAHKRIREELEGAVLAFAEQPRAPEKHQTYIIVAPFGSGKSTLLNYLRCFSICNNIPAIKINLSELVIFLKNKNEEIYEDQFPNYIYKFFEEKRKELLKTGNYEFESCSVDRNVVKRALQRSDVGILLIDEIEETYDELKKTVKANTTPFRGLYDAVWQGESKILPILAFGPTSAYKEATSLSGSWRVQIRSLPIVYPSKIDLPNADPHIKNLVWWIGKGRIGHTQSIAKTIASSGRFDIQGIKEVLENFKGREVVEGTPYIDTRQKERLVRTSQDPEDIELLEITSIKIGPIPVAELKNLNKDKLIYTKKQYFVVSRKLIEIDKVISNIENAISSILATTSTPKNSVNYEFARDLIRSVIESWSNHQYLIYDRAALTELLDLVKYMAIELYMPELFGILSKLNLDAVFDNLDKEALIMDQFYVALRPSILAKIYPIILLNPLIGSSRKLDYDKLFNFIQNLDSTEVFILSDIFMKLLKIFYENLDVQILILPERLFYDDKTRRDVIRKWIHSNERKIVIIGLSRDEIKIDEPWQRLKNLGILDIEFAYDKIMWFIAGVLYDIKERGYPRDPEKLKEWINTLDELERNILQQYITALEKLIEQSLNKTQKTQLVNLDVIREAQELDRYDYQVGRGHYKYLWLLSISSETTKNIIKDSINYLKEIEEEFKKLEENKIINKSKIEKGKLTQGFGELLERGEEFMKKISDIISKINRNDIRYLNDIYEVWIEAPIVKSIQKKSQKNKMNFINLAKEFCDKIILRIQEELGHTTNLCNAIAYLVMKSDTECDRSSTEQITDTKINALSMLSLQESINSFLNEINTVDNIKTTQFYQDIVDLLGKINAITDKIKQFKEYLTNVDEYKFDIECKEFDLIHEFLYEKILQKFAENIDIASASFIEIKKQFDEIIGIIRNIKRQIYNDNSFRKYINEDLIDIFNRSEGLIRLKENLHNYSNIIMELQNTVNEYNKKRSQYEEIIRGYYALLEQYE